MGNDQILDLDLENEIQKFNFEYPFSFLSIKKIIVSSLFGKEPDEWLQEIVSKNIHLEIHLTKSDGSTLTYPIMLMSFISTMHRNPVFEFRKNEFIIPEDNLGNKSSFSPFFRQGEIRLKHKEDVENINLKIIYEAAPGTSLV